MRVCRTEPVAGDVTFGYSFFVYFIATEPRC
ncbi:hypothetical protein J2S42_006540 [Catenuloplanes indicus]|uniref:Uncharacterized protein n=1 Tax=Catenuloplanes indicus TaxID=137267 RepID=A0AAE4B1R2_9ACTN|nr:hypothetical protein [Catenuloplanes indicus]